uniref:Uncharacterized protein n=1 Tax=Romanomermis culicivorax TaxID=13658 RepID=A0A915K5D1_ROMCU
MNINNTNPWWGVFTAMQKLEEVEKFTYLGSVISEDGNAQVDIKCHIRKAAARDVEGISQQKQQAGCLPTTLPPLNSKDLLH